jgi:integrase/recombinase XerD
MSKFNAKNERIKRDYFVFLTDAKQHDESTVDVVAKAISRFEIYTNKRDFKAFHFEQAVGFKKHLAKQKNLQTGKPLSKATMRGTLAALKRFFQWLSMQSGYKSSVSYSDAEYFNQSEKDARIATAKRSKPVPTLEQIKHVLEVMPSSSLVEMRNRALIAFVLLTGARDSAVASFKLKHVNLSARSVFQDAREVNTKASKTFTTYFFPVGDEVAEIVVQWVNYLREELLFGEDDPLFPRTEVKPSATSNFEATGLTREHWKTADPIRKIFKGSFEAAGLSYFNPHSFRNTLVRLGEKIAASPEGFKAWSQNLGHSGVLTTFYSYGEVQESRQAEILGELRLPLVKGVTDDADRFADAILDRMERRRLEGVG